MSFTTKIKRWFQYRYKQPLAAGPLIAKAYSLSQPADGCFWVRADPVKLEADHQRVFMRGHTGVGLEKKTVAPLLTSLNQLLNQDNLEIIYLTPTQWVLKGNPGSPPLCNITSHSSVHCLNQDISDLLPWGEHQAYWRRLFTECQMIMQPYDNNSVWFWGAGISE